MKDEKHTTKTPSNLTVPRSFNFSTERRLAKGAGVSSVSKVGLTQPKEGFIVIIIKTFNKIYCFRLSDLDHPLFPWLKKFKGFK